MSRLFEALQRSEPEGFSLEFPQPDLPATEALKTETRKEAAEPQLRALGEFVSVPLMPAPDGRLISLTDKESLGAEKFRFLSVRLRQMCQTRPCKKLLITSTVPEEGKSMVSANLALTLARKKAQKVILLDGDLRRPVLAREFGVKSSPGLSDWLLGDAKRMPIIYNLEASGLCFLPAGHPPENALELMQSSRLGELLEQLAAAFDWIIVDSPPVLPLGDTSVWMRLVEGVLLVVREGVTQKRQLQRGLEVLDQSKLLGTVLNSCTDTDHGDYYQRYGPAAQPQADAPAKS
jgi:capsular exopolysaccharide synthesis family protein